MTSEIATTLLPLGTATVKFVSTHYCPCAEVQLLLHNSVKLLEEPKDRCVMMSRYWFAHYGDPSNHVEFLKPPKKIWVGKGRHRRKEIASLNLRVLLFEGWEEEVARFCEYVKGGVYFAKGNA